MRNFWLFRRLYGGYWVQLPTGQWVKEDNVSLYNIMTRNGRCKGEYHG